MQRIQCGQIQLKTYSKHNFIKYLKQVYEKKIFLCFRLECGEKKYKVGAIQIIFFKFLPFILRHTV